MNKITFFIVTLAVCSTHSFSFKNRVFVSTPVSNYPKKLVKDCMSVPFVLNPNDTVENSISALLSSGHSSSPVCDEHGNLIGMVSSFDFLQKEAFEGALLSMSGSSEQVESYVDAAKKICAQKVSDIMTPNPVSIAPDMTMRAAATLMNQEKVHRLPVVDGEGSLVGVITSSDVMKDLLHIHQNLPPANGEDSVAP